MPSIKYRDGQNFPAVSVKVGDTLPVGTELDYDGDSVPLGWEQVADGDLIVSSTEPSGDDRRKVWLQQTKNLFNKNNVTLNCYVNKDNGTLVTNYSNNSSDYMKVSGQYVVVSGGYDTDTYALYDNTKTYLRGGAYTNGTAIDVTNASYIRITVKPAVMDTFQLELGETSTTYEPYVQDETYILNDNNVYEEYTPQNEIYSTNEVRIGTWIDGKPLYRKVFTGTTANGTGFINLATDIDYFQIINASFPSLGNRPHFYYLDTTNDRSGLDIAKTSSTTLQYRTLNNQLFNQPYIFVLEYTKTTD